MSKYKKTLKNIIKFINDDSKLKLIFYNKTKNRKYKPRQLLEYVLHILKSGISYRMHSEMTNYKTNNIPHHATIYKFFMKLIKYNVIQDTFKATVAQYMVKHKVTTFITDTSLVANKNGSDNVSYNPQLAKHKSTKISVISDDKGIPLDINIYSSNMNDSKILNMHLDTFTNNVNFEKNNNNLLLADSGYDSNVIRDKLANLRFGQLLVPRNKRNTKNKNKLANYKLTPKEKNVMKNRINVEHIFQNIKAHRRVNIRYDRSSVVFLNYVLLGGLCRF